MNRDQVLEFEPEQKAGIFFPKEPYPELDFRFNYELYGTGIGTETNSKLFSELGTKRFFFVKKKKKKFKTQEPPNNTGAYPDTASLASGLHSATHMHADRAPGKFTKKKN